LSCPCVGDPAEIGLVPSLNMPGGNITGMGVFCIGARAKRIDLHVRGEEAA
jgi:hypothetical protein